MHLPSHLRCLVPSVIRVIQWLTRSSTLRSSTLGTDHYCENNLLAILRCSEIWESLRNGTTVQYQSQFRDFAFSTSRIHLKQRLFWGVRSKSIPYTLIANGREFHSQASWARLGIAISHIMRRHHSKAQAHIDKSNQEIHWFSRFQFEAGINTFCLQWNWRIVRVYIYIYIKLWLKTQLAVDRF